MPGISASDDRNSGENEVAKRLTTFIMIALVLGLVVGWGINASISDGSAATNEQLKEIAGYFSIVTTLFLRLIKMIIAPLVFSTLVVGIAHMGDTTALGRVGLRSLTWFIGASLVSLSLGLLLVNLLQPGVGLNLPLPPVTETAGLAKGAFSLKDFITHLVPASMIEAMATNEILQIVVFSVFVGVAITAVGEKAAPLVKATEALVHVMLQITDYVMRFAPFAVFAAVAGTLTERGPGVIGDLAYFMGSFYIGLFILWSLLLGVAFLVVGKRTGQLVRYLREPILLGFSTASSEAAFPRTLEALDRFGVPPRIASFVLPLGYSFNLDGSMMYMTFAAIFIAQAYGIDLTLGQEITMLLVLMVTSKGIAGVPRASLVVIAATLPLFKIPEAGLLLILAVDHFLDMGRTATNVIGNAVAATVIAKWEGGLDPIEPAEIEPPHAPSNVPGAAEKAPESFRDV
jgi:Na+/H+-dicarboxylate symporter